MIMSAPPTHGCHIALATCSGTRATITIALLFPIVAPVATILNGLAIALAPPVTIIYALIIAVVLRVRCYARAVGAPSFEVNAQKRDHRAGPRGNVRVAGQAS
jgi:hypothetical protein